MKKKFMLFLASVLVLGMFAGCGDKAAESGDASGDVAATGIEYNALDYVTLGDYKGLTIEATKYMVFDSDVESFIQQILASSYVESDRTVVESGDRITVDYALSKDGEEIESNSSTFVVGAGTMISDFDNAMVGAKVGEEFTFDATFPETYQNTDLAGQTTQFTVTVNKIEVSAELTDEWVEATYKENLDIATVDELRAKVREELQKEADQNTLNGMQTALLSAAIDCCTVNGLPEGLVEQKIAESVEELRTQATNYGYEFEEYLSLNGYDSEDALKEAMQEPVESYLGQILICEAIIANEGWVIDDAAIDDYLDYYASYYNYESFEVFLEENGPSQGWESKDDFIAYMTANGMDVNDIALQYKILKMLEENCTVNYIEQVETTASGDAE